MHIKLICVLLSSLSLLRMYAQQTEVFSSDIYTPQVVVNQNSFLPPVIMLNSEDEIEISFDQLTHEYRRYQYVISHHNADWTPSGLFEMDYLEGFNNLPIENYDISLNTTVPYTHYSLSFPNERVRFTKSGNYQVTIYNEDDNDTPVLRACFHIVENHISIAAKVSTDTDINRNKSHQQVSFTVNYSGYDIRNPQNEIKVQVIQNQRTDNIVTNIQPTYLTSSELRYEHNKQLIFPAGNEYRRFEMVSVRYASQGVEEIGFYDPYYHITLFPDEPRTKNYIYDKDQNGRYVIRYDQATDNNIEADYFFVHFSFPRETPFANGDLYLQGAFANKPNESYKLSYNEEDRAYQLVRLLKQGAYNYQYLFVPNEQQQGITDFTEGNYYQTENEYLILVYHRPWGERYDKLIGYKIAYFN